MSQWGGVCVYCHLACPNFILTPLNIDYYWRGNFYCYEIKFGLEPPYKKQFLRISSWCCMLILTLFFMRFAISKGSFLLGSRKCQTIVSIWHSKKHKQVLNCVDSTFSAINYLLTMSFSYSSVLFTSILCLLFVFDNILQL